ncbi:MAG TPA: hypothetical protein PLK35_02295 [Candidatus Moranbacteria bacterium]|nr:hypothetical protein [Candidatus Moranbacteria bacterium]
MARDFLLLSESYGEKGGKSLQSLHTKLAVVKLLDESYQVRNFSANEIAKELEKRGIVIGKTGIYKISTLYKTVFNFLSAKPETVEEIKGWIINGKLATSNQRSILSIIDCFTKDGIRTWQDVKKLWEEEDRKRQKDRKLPEKKPEEIPEVIFSSQLPETPDDIRKLAEEFQKGIDRCYHQSSEHLNSLCELYFKALSDLKKEFAELADDYQQISKKCAKQEEFTDRVKRKIPETCQKLLAEIRKSKNKNEYLETALKEKEVGLKKAKEDMEAYEALLSELQQKISTLQGKNQGLEKALLVIRNQFSEKMEGFLKEIFNVNDSAEKASPPDKTELSDLSLPLICLGNNGQPDMEIVYSDESQKYFLSLPVEIQERMIEKIPHILFQGKSGNRTKKHETKGERYFHSRINDSFRIEWKFENGKVFISRIYHKKDV